MQEFEEYLRNNLLSINTFHPIYSDALNQMVLAGGKRFRPKLMLGIVQAYEPMLYKSSLPVALALEIFHTYSLIHDDLPAMDDSPLRRGEVTLHMRYDEATAVLAGDALNSDAFLLISKAPLRDDVKIKLIETLGENGGSRGMVLGQAIDCYFENRPLTLEQIKELHTNKTAKLIAASMLMGTIIVRLDGQTQQKIYDFGINLGLLFQVQDDIIDVTQDEKEAGKTTSNDSDKNSFVNLLGLEGSIEQANEIADSLAREFDSFEPQLQTALAPLMEQYLYRHKTQGKI